MSSEAKDKTIKAVVIEQYGGPEVLKYVDNHPAFTYGDDDVLIDVVFASINYIDTYQRTGLYQVKLPAVLGRDGSGIVAAVGKNVKHVAAGDRVAWALGTGYASQVAVNKTKVVKIPSGISLANAAAAMIQGLTAHYLLRSSYEVKKGDTILVHAAAGGTGQLLVQIATSLGATVIGTVSTKEKAEIAKACGAAHVINYSEQNFAEEVKKITNGQGVHAVYDGVGKSTYLGSLESLRKRGTCVLFGNASGPVPPVDPLLLTKYGSVYLTRPSLADYVLTQDEFQARCDDVFNWMKLGLLQIKVYKTFPLAETNKAHELIESREATGKILLLVDEARSGL